MQSGVGVPDAKYWAIVGSIHRFGSAVLGGGAGSGTAVVSGTGGSTGSTVPKFANVSAATIASIPPRVCPIRWTIRFMRFMVRAFQPER